MSKHVMLDLETWGTRETAVIISIGAVRFEPYGVPPTDFFSVGVDPRGQLAYGRKIEAETVLWWMDPERDETRHAWLKSQKFDLATALEGFAMWFKEGGEKQCVWGNAATFDNAILRSAYESLSMECPWEFWNDRCFRTLKNLAPKNLEPVREGEHHDALDDAKHQVRWLDAIVQATNIIL